MTNIERAYMIAEKAHRNQSYDIYTYMFHIRMVAGIAESLGFDEIIIIACILHDTIEDTDITYNDIKKAFNEEIAEIVYAVTDELGRNRKERKGKTLPKIRNNWKAVVVKICDRIGNMTHSKSYNKDKFKMYTKEYATFRKEITNPEHKKREISIAWVELEKIIA